MCAINAITRSQFNAWIGLLAVGVLVLLLSACGTFAPAPTPEPTITPTPRATPLPPPPTPIPFGSVDRPYRMIALKPSGTSVTGDALASFLKDRTLQDFKVDLLDNNAEIIALLCGTEPLFAWVDGWTMLLAQAQGCASPQLRIKQGEATGFKADLITSTGTNISNLAGLRQAAKGRNFCRVSGQETLTWLLPIVTLRNTAEKFDPINGFQSVKEYSDVPSMVQDVSNANCVGAIESGTLEKYKLPNVPNPKDTIRVVATTPELPFGGLVASNAVPGELTKQVADIMSRNVDQLKDLVKADALVVSGPTDLRDLQQVLEAGGFDLVALGR